MCDRSESAAQIPTVSTDRSPTGHTKIISLKPQKWLVCVVDCDSVCVCVKVAASYMSEQRNMLNVNFWTDTSEADEKARRRQSHRKKKKQKVEARKQGTEFPSVQACQS